MLKKILGILLVSILLLSSAGCAGNLADKANSNEEMSGTITISGAWALYPMAIKWAEEFQKIYPKIRIDISAGGAGKGMADALGGSADLGMISREIYTDEINKGAWYVSVTKDAVVAVFNKDNPVINEILSQGVKKETLVDIWINGKTSDWKDVVSVDSGKTNQTVINLYTRSDACGAGQVWADFLGGAQEDLLGVGIYGDPGILEAVKKDTLGIGYNNINYAFDAKTKLPVGGTLVLPIDLNDNGKIDEDENFYNNLGEITKAIAAKKYPSPPARDLYFVSKGKPEAKIVIMFLRWILSDGQKYVSESGYINLPKEKIDTELKKIDG